MRARIKVLGLSLLFDVRGIFVSCQTLSSKAVSPEHTISARPTRIGANGVPSCSQSRPTAKTRNCSGLEGLRQFLALPEYKIWRAFLTWFMGEFFPTRGCGPPQRRFLRCLFASRTERAKTHAILESRGGRSYEICLGKLRSWNAEKHKPIFVRPERSLR